MCTYPEWGLYASGPVGDLVWRAGRGFFVLDPSTTLSFMGVQYVSTLPIPGRSRMVHYFILYYIAVKLLMPIYLGTPAKYKHQR